MKVVKVRKHIRHIGKNTTNKEFLLGDFDRDSVPNVDDKKPFLRGGGQVIRIWHTFQNFFTTYFHFSHIFLINSCTSFVLNF